jgi:hypothetical protein
MGVEGLASQFHLTHHYTLPVAPPAFHWRRRRLNGAPQPPRLGTQRAAADKMCTARVSSLDTVLLDVSRVIVLCSERAVNFASPADFLIIPEANFPLK